MVVGNAWHAQVAGRNEQRQKATAVRSGNCRNNKTAGRKVVWQVMVLRALFTAKVRARWQRGGGNGRCAMRQR